MGSIYESEPAYTVQAWWQDGAEESFGFYGPGAFDDASAKFRELRGKGRGYKRLVLSRRDGPRWVAVEEVGDAPHADKDGA
jgi:hypothetical protein